ncbi:hypothetical protein RB195_022977 [Necator americanus]|uniref:Uncharacterized protein n=1 Tax=Necator americanus TaxID=51031 RepID=A0ABR1EHB6_NECAM
MHMRPARLQCRISYTICCGGADKNKIISAYTPVETAGENNKDACYDEFKVLVSKIPSRQVVVVGIDANAKIVLSNVLESRAVFCGYHPSTIRVPLDRSRVRRRHCESENSWKLQHVVALVSNLASAYRLFLIALGKLHMIALENVELETALAKDLRKDNIIALKWFVPAPKSRIFESDSPVMSGLSKVHSFESLPSMPDVKPDIRPKLLIAYAHGVIQLMRDENDITPIVIRFPQLTVTCARWCPNGNFFAVTGQQLNMPVQESCVVHVVTAFGVKLSSLQILCSSLTGCSWDSTGVRLALSAENLIWFAKVRPRYKWGYCGHTVVYSYERIERGDYRVAFYETKLDELYSKPVQQLEQLATGRNYCIIASRQEDPNGKGNMLSFCSLPSLPNRTFPRRKRLLRGV